MAFGKIIGRRFPLYLPYITKSIHPKRFTILIMCMPFMRKLMTTKNDAKYPITSMRLIFNFESFHKGKQIIWGKDGVKKPPPAGSI